MAGKVGPMLEESDANTAELLADVTRGDAGAAERLLPVVYDELRRLAERYFRNQAAGQTLQATSLVHEAYLKLVNQPDATYAGKTHFKAVAAKAMRHLLIDRARGKKALKHGGGGRRVRLDEAMVPAADRDVDVVALEEALAGLARLDERMSRIVELRFFGGLTNVEVAEVLGVARSTVAEQWRAARAWLLSELRNEASSSSSAPGEESRGPGDVPGPR